MVFNLQYFLLLLNLAASQSGVFGEPVSNKLLDVCVVGGGPSGITFGRLLKANGISYQVFEEDNKVGGKATTWRDGKNFVEMGAYWFNVKPNNHLSDMVKGTKLTVTRYNATKVELYNQLGFTIPAPSTSELINDNIRAAIEKYEKLRISYNLQVGYVNSPPETHQPFLSWLKVNSLDAIAPLFTTIVTIQGFGKLDQIPALYVLRVFEAKWLLSFTGFFNSYYNVEEGLDVLWSTLSSDLNLKLNSRVRYIKRHRNHKGEYTSILIFSDPLQPSVHCKNVILSIPPYLEKLKCMLSNISKEEQNILSKVRYIHYSSSVIQAPEWKSELLFNAISDVKKFPYEPVGNGEAIAFLKQGKYYSTYSWVKGSFPNPTSTQDLSVMNQKQNTLLSNLDQERNVTNPSRVVNSYYWEYFSHVLSNDIKEGYFKKFDKMQGTKNTFYASSLLSFENMGGAVDLAYHIFETKILPKFKNLPSASPSKGQKK